MASSLASTAGTSRGQQGRMQTTGMVAAAPADGPALRLDKAVPPLQFFLRCAARERLEQALASCDARVAASGEGSETARQPVGEDEGSIPPVPVTEGTASGARLCAHAALDASSAYAGAVPFSLLSEDRLRTALQALLDLKALLVCFGSKPIVDSEIASSRGSCKKGQDECDDDGEAAAAQRSTQGASDSVIDAPHGCTCWVRRGHYDAVVALAQLSEAAVPPRSPPLVSADAMLLHRGTPRLEYHTQCPSPTAESLKGVDETKATVELVASPAAYDAVVSRLRTLERLWQLRFAYTVLMPEVRRCVSLADLQHLLFSHSPELIERLDQLSSHPQIALSSRNLEHLSVPASSAAVQQDALCSIPGITSRHRCEQAALVALVEATNRCCTVDTASWGAMALLPPLRLTDGVYVVHHTLRQHAMTQLLKEAELYGLPPFLRSIRRYTVSDHWGPMMDTFFSGSSSRANEGGAPWWAASSSASSSAVSAAGGGGGGGHTAPRFVHRLFLTPESLNPAEFTSPDPMQAPIVQEELIDLARRHCCFGLLVGDADQILCVMKRASEYTTSLWERRLKREQQQTDATAAANIKVEATSCERHATSTGGEEMQSSEACAAARRTGPLNAPLRDPLAPYVRRVAAIAARRASAAAAVGSSSEEEEAVAPYCHVEWLSPNRWSPEATYYGLAFGIILESEATSRLLSKEDGVVDGEQPKAPLDVDATAAQLEQLTPQKEVTYYVAAVMELSRRGR